MAFLKHVSVFEIYRLSGAIQNELENPQRLAKVNHKIKEGDFVGFYHQNYGEHIAGCVERLNQKTVSLITPGKRWRVSYQLLYPIIDGEQIETLQRIEHQLDLTNFTE